METYRERVRWPGWLCLLAVLGVGVALVSAVIVVGRHGLELTAILPLGVVIVVGAVVWRFRHLALEFGPDGAAFGFGGLNRRVQRSGIVSAEAADYSAARFMGWGYRIGWEPRERAYSVLGYRRGVRLVFDDDRGRRWNVFVSCGDPEAAVAALRA